MSDSLRMSVVSDDGDALVSIAGELDLDNAAGLEECFASLPEDAGQRLVVDCSLLTFCDTTGLAVFARHLPLSVRAPHPNFRRILEIAGFNSLIERA